MATASQLAAASGPSLPDLSILAAPAGHRLLFKAQARGLQIYPCDTTTQTFGPPRPEAILIADDGEIIHHFKGPNGPTWQAGDGSNVAGTLVHKVAAPDPNAIPWLLLFCSPGGTPDGRMSSVSLVQRVYTKQGQAPAGRWDSNWTSDVPVFYEAVYCFYVKE